MADSKVSIRIGQIEFTGEGEAAWVESQLDKLIAKAPELLRLAPTDKGKGGHDAMVPDPEIASKALGAYLRERDATVNTNKKFLATSVWLESKGKKRLKPADVVKALRENSQTRLGNPSQCLANNIGQGHCERDGDEYFVTEDGKRSLVA